MPRNRTADIIILILLAAILAAGTWYLMALRFRSGDVYPSYSSLRSDPLGSKAFYDALDHIPSVSVKRHYSDLEDLDTRRGDTVLILGLSSHGLGSLEKALDRLTASGTRVVVSFEERGQKPEEPEEESSDDSTWTGHEEEVDDGEETDLEKVERGQWDFKFKMSVANENSAGKYPASLSIESPDLPGQITVSSPVYFDAWNEKWRAVYSLDEGPVMLLRELGQGSTVLVSDSYPFSNEALRWELYPRLLSWILTETRSVVFVESHLGVRETQGLMSLVKRYRLIPLFSCMIAIVLLITWKIAVPLAPIPDTAADDEGRIISEKDQFTGLVSLLKRNISASNVVNLCLSQWKKSSSGKPGMSGHEFGSLKDLPDHGDGVKDPVKAYNRLTNILNER